MSKDLMSIMIAQNADLPKLLENAEATADLYASLSTYAPSQQRLAFDSQILDYPSMVLTAIENLVRLRLWLLHNYVGYLFFWSRRILMTAANCTMTCFIASSAFSKLSFLMAKDCIGFRDYMMRRICWTRSSLESVGGHKITAERAGKMDEWPLAEVALGIPTCICVLTIAFQLLTIIHAIQYETQLCTVNQRSLSTC